MTPEPTHAAPHILIIVENLPVPADRRVWLEATTLQRAGYEVSVVCPIGHNYNSEYEVLDGVHIYRHPLKEATSPAGYLAEYLSAVYHEFRLAARAWRRRRFSLVHICNPPDLLFLVAGWYRLIHGVRVIFDHHDLSPELYVTKYGKQGIVYKALRLLEAATFRTAHTVISTNESYKKIAMARGGKADQDVTVVRSGPELRNFSRTEDRKAATGVTVGYVGVVAEQDGVELLIDAMTHVVSEAPDLQIRLTIVGDGPSLDSLKKRAHDAGLDDVVTFTGFLTGTRFLDTISTFDIGVCPDPKNPYNDKCTMNKILEYMALGIPVVQFDLTEGRNSAGAASLYAEPNEPRSLAAHILTLARDPAARKSMGDIGLERMRSMLSWEHSAPRLLQAYDRALGKVSSKSAE